MSAATPAPPAEAPAVTVVTPVWNAAATLGECVASLAAQTRGDWEMLIVDDGSTDGSRALAAALAEGDGRIRLLGWGARRGAAAARNEGIRAARGRFIAFLDADDLWRPEKLEVQIGYMEASGAPFTFAAVRRIDEAGRPLGVLAAPARVDHARLLKGNVIPCQTAVYDRLHYGAVEMPPLPRRQDYGLWLTLLARGGEAHGLPQVLADWRMRRGSLSANKLVAAAATWRVYREVAGLGRGRAAWHLGHNLARGALKRVGG
ncbi:MAG: glycosyltransferase family 2 protein [Rhodobacteraceae bacterium]|nr:glycosyltransferase family 2 protein [Paracoccaceae bacterium]